MDTLIPSQYISTHFHFQYLQSIYHSSACPRFSCCCCCCPPTECKQATIDDLAIGFAWSVRLLCVPAVCVCVACLH